MTKYDFLNLSFGEHILYYETDLDKTTFVFEKLKFGIQFREIDYQDYFIPIFLDDYFIVIFYKSGITFNSKFIYKNFSLL